MEPITIFVLGVITISTIEVVIKKYKNILAEEEKKDRYVFDLFGNSAGDLKEIEKDMKQKSTKRNDLEEEIKTTQSEIEELTDSRNFIEENMDEEEEFESEDYYGTMEEVNDIDEQIGILEEDLEKQKAELEKMNDYE